jgi:hypothetical protein
MSAYRDSLPDDETRPGYDTAIARAAALLAKAYQDTHLLAHTHGTRAVAEAAWHPGHELTVEQIQARYEAMREAAGRQQAA